MKGGIEEIKDKNEDENEIDYDYEDEGYEDYEDDEDNAMIDEALDDPEAPMYSRVSFGKWMIVLLIIAIPVVNVVMLLVWALGSRTNPSLSNFSRAFLIYFILAAALVFAVSTTVINFILKMVNLA